MNLGNPSPSLSTTGDTRKLLLLRLGCGLILLLVFGVSFYIYSQKLPPGYYVSLEILRGHVEQERKDLADLKKTYNEQSAHLTANEKLFYTDLIKKAEDSLNQAEQIGSPRWECTKTIFKQYWKPILGIQMAAGIVLLTCYPYLRERIIGPSTSSPSHSASSSRPNT